jgi:hypothetical protein
MYTTRPSSMVGGECCFEAAASQLRYSYIIAAFIVTATVVVSTS